MARLLCVVCGVLVWFSPTVADAASLYLDPASSTINRGDSVTVAIRVDTDEAAGECINAVDGTIVFDDSIQPVDVSLGQSIISLWVEAPVLAPGARSISFAGGIPNGYCGRIAGDPRLSNVIAEVVFRSPGLQIGGGESVNQATVSLREDSAVYLNDGAGTKATLSLYPAVIYLSPGAGSTINDTWRTAVQNDSTPPQEFSITLGQYGSSFNGQYFIEFNTTDKETGLSHYEVMEEASGEFARFRWGRTDAPWVAARSPYVLKDQSLNSVILVRAIDKAGNEYVATLIPEESLRTISRERLLMVGIAVASLMVLIAVVVLSLWWYRRRMRGSEDNVVTPQSPDHV